MPDFSVLLGGGGQQNQQNDGKPRVKVKFPWLVGALLLLLIIVVGLWAVQTGVLSGGQGDITPTPEEPAEGAAPSTGGGQTTGGGGSGCQCQGVDYICKNADGSIASASYNSTQCGGSGQCECRGDDKALACPDGTYAAFNPQCGVGGGGECTCIPDPTCSTAVCGKICQETGAACQ
jgi:hypothetical protein